MAKGQMRGNREIRKPKKEKKPDKVPAPSGTQVRLADNGNVGHRKPQK